MTITKEASTFYFTYAMLLLCRKYLNDLIASQAVAHNLKQDLRILVNKITHIERIANKSLENKDAETWRKEWTERDYEVFANIFGILNDLPEDRRMIAEDFMIELSNGNVRAEIA